MGIKCSQLAQDRINLRYEKAVFPAVDIVAQFCSLNGTAPKRLASLIDLPNRFLNSDFIEQHL